MTIIGRQKEQELLQEALNSEKAEFIAIYGRKRVGKAFLIRQFFRDKGIYFEVAGCRGMTKATQLQNFTTVFSDTFNEGQRLETPKNWYDAFNLLRYKLEEFSSSKNIILFFNELPWLASRKSGFMEALDLFWNQYFSQMPHLKLFMSGSAGTWMLEKLINNTDGLYKRLSRPAIHLQTLSLEETRLYLLSKGVSMDRQQVLDLYMALGGIPEYLNLVCPGRSSAQIISDLFFSPSSSLRSEFYSLYDSLFGRPKKHLEIVELLSSHPQGLTQKELFAKSKNIRAGGGGVDILEELESSSFILKIPLFGKKKRDARYRLIDALSLFYLNWVRGLGDYSLSHWLKVRGSEKYKNWAAYAFENICLLHYDQIVKNLDLSIVAQGRACWRYLPANGDGTKQEDVDLVIDRSDACINLCNIQYHDDEFELNHSSEKDLRKKKLLFKDMTGTKKAVFLTLISSYGVRRSDLYHNVIDSQLTPDALF
ncbi:Uncharacterized protein SCG7109_AH_00360 [Chlamydiales bacterium SCGC AG-110-M15]|nr:Uncharacterized protein SCG7109_AH_00360 [Chlamydiales bacterium SCGC AG-110-M15]